MSRVAPGRGISQPSATFQNGVNYGTFRVTYGIRKKVSVACGERGLSPAVTHHVLQRFAELGQLKLESFLFEPLGNDIATVEG